MAKKKYPTLGDAAKAGGVTNDVGKALGKFGSYTRKLMKR